MLSLWLVESAIVVREPGRGQYALLVQGVRQGAGSSSIMKGIRGLGRRRLWGGCVQDCFVEWSECTVLFVMV